MRVIRTFSQEFKRETKEAIVYYESAFKQKLDDIYIIGGSALLPDILKEIKVILGRNAELAVNSFSVKLNSLATLKNHFPLFANVIGLGMLGASGEFRDLNLLKKMPSSEVNSVNKLNLFSMNYLSRVNTIRTIMNNKFVLVIMIILIAIVFAILLQQAQNYGFATASSPTIGNNIFRW